jgi:hypothetical protein
MVMKRKMICLMVGFMIIGMVTGCSKEKNTDVNTTTHSTTSTTNKNNSVGMANPFVDYDSMGEAAKQAGFSFEVPDSIDGYEGTQIQAIDNELIQVQYGEPDKANILIRKSKGSEDISGDYNEYSENNKMLVGDVEVQVRGENGKVYVVTWVMDDYTYAIDANEGIDTTVVSSIVSNLK